ncbi:MAG UNVERIFIED_CONTAM: hypothetical protein LVR29_32025 [Microcystis novacekii LVE1205-3]|jgi:exoribonuclease-2
MQEILYSVASLAVKATSVERQTNRYWSLEFLRRQGDQVWQALVLRWLRGRGKFRLDFIGGIGVRITPSF